MLPTAAPLPLPSPLLRARSLGASVERERERGRGDRSSPRGSGVGERERERERARVSGELPLSDMAVRRSVSLNSGGWSGVGGGTSGRGESRRAERRRLQGDTDGGEEAADLWLLPLHRGRVGGWAGVARRVVTGCTTAPGHPSRLDTLPKLFAPTSPFLFRGETDRAVGLTHDSNRHHRFVTGISVSYRFATDTQPKKGWSALHSQGQGGVAGSGTKMARSKAAARQGKSPVGREVQAEGGKAARKAAKQKIKAKGRLKHAAKKAKQEQKRAARLEREASASASTSPDGPDDSDDDGFIELSADDNAAPVVRHGSSADVEEGEEDASSSRLMLESMPWMGERAGYSHPNLYVCLHEEIMDFVRFMSPTEDEVRRRDELIAEMRQVVGDLWAGATLETFGSHHTQMFLPKSDIDMVIFGVADGTGPLFELAQRLEELDMVSYLEVIDKARIPIVKLVHKDSGIHIDMSFNIAGGLATADLVKHYMRLFPAFRPLTLLLKYFLAQRGLNETFAGGIGSFLLQMMVVSFLQHHRRSLASKHDDPKFNNLGQLLLGFFTLYGRDFNYNELAISVRNGGSYFYKEDRSWYDGGRPFLISMENPNEPSLDIGKNSYEIRTVKRAFEYARQVLLNEIHRRGQFHSLSGSILGTIIPPDSHLLERTAPSEFGFEILYHDPKKTSEIKKQYEKRRSEEMEKKRQEAEAKRERNKARRSNSSQEPPHKRWRGRTSRNF